MTILYLHGLESKLNPEKRAILERFATVIAPDMDYHNDPNIFDLLLKSNEKNQFDIVMGSSMGGLWAIILLTLSNVLRYYLIQLYHTDPFLKIFLK